MNNNKKMIEIADKIINLYNTYGWCRDTEAKDKKGKSVGIKSPKAASFCMMGAIERCTRYGNPRENFTDMFNSFVEKITGKTIVNTNDTILKNKREAVKLFKKFKKTLEQENG